MKKSNKILIIVGIVLILAVIGSFMKKETPAPKDVKTTEVQKDRDFQYKIIGQSPYGLASRRGYKYTVKVNHKEVSKADLYKLAKLLFSTTDNATSYKEFTLFVADDVNGMKDTGIFSLVATKCCFLEDTDIVFKELLFNLEDKLLKD